MFFFFRFVYIKVGIFPPPRTYQRQLEFLFEAKRVKYKLLAGFTDNCQSSQGERQIFFLLRAAPSATPKFFGLLLLGGGHKTFRLRQSRTFDKIERAEEVETFRRPPRETNLICMLFFVGQKGMKFMEGNYKCFRGLRQSANFRKAIKTKYMALWLFWQFEYIFTYRNGKFE